MPMLCCLQTLLLASKRMRWFGVLPGLLLAGAFCHTALAVPRLETSAPDSPLTSGAWRNFASFDGPVVDSILCLHMTENGYLWVGTTAGVSVRAPSGVWVTLDMDDGLAGNRVTAITTDPTDPQHHWFATNGGASLLDDGGTPLDKRNHQWMTFGKRDGLLDPRLSSVTIAPNGDLWFGLTYIGSGVRVGNGISVLNLNGTPFDKADDHWTSFTAANSNLSTDVIHKLATDAAGIIWIATQSGLNAYQNGQWRLFSSEQGLPANEITTFAFTDSHLWIGTSDGFGLLDYGATLADNSDDHWQTHPSAATFTAPITGLAVDPHGYLWVGATEIRESVEVGAAMILDLNQTPFDFSDDQALALDTTQVPPPRAIALARQAVWFGTNAGVHHLTYATSPFNPEQWQWRSDAGGNGLDGSSVTAIAAGAGDRLALAVDGQATVLLYAYTPHNLRDDQWLTLQGTAVSILAADQKKRLWLGSGDSLVLLDPGPRLQSTDDDEVHRYNAASGLRLEQINKLALDTANRAWIANSGYLQGGLTVLSAGDSVQETGDDQMTTFTAQNSGLPGKYVTAVAFGQQGDVWLGTTVGAAHLQYGASPFAKTDDQWTTYTPHNSGIADQHVRDIAIDPTGNVWFALATGGISVYTPEGEWITFTEADGLLMTAVNAVAVGQDGHLWFGTDGEGISVLNYGTTVQDKSDDSWISYLLGAPLLSGYIQTITVDGWGQVWVGTFGGGLSVYSTVAFNQVYLPLLYTPNQSPSLSNPSTRTEPVSGSRGP